MSVLSDQNCYYTKKIGYFLAEIYIPKEILPPPFCVNDCIVRQEFVQLPHPLLELVVSPIGEEPALTPTEGVGGLVPRVHAL